MKHWGKLFIASCLVLSLAAGCSTNAKEPEKSNDAINQSNDSDQGSTGVQNVVNPLETKKENLTALAELASENISISEDEEGKYIVELQDKQYSFEWTGMTPRGIEPRLSYEDFDNDGQKELAVILYSGSGTGVSVEELHMLELNEDATIVDVKYEEEQFLNELKQQVSLTLNKEEQALKATVSFNDQNAEVDLSALLDESYGEVNDQLGWGNYISFEFDGAGIVGLFKANVTVANQATPIGIGDIKATIGYGEDGFTLQLQSFEAQEEII